MPHLLRWPQGDLPRLWLGPCAAGVARGSPPLHDPTHVACPHRKWAPPPTCGPGSLGGPPRAAQADGLAWCRGVEPCGAHPPGVAGGGVPCRFESHHRTPQRHRGTRRASVDRRIAIHPGPMRGPSRVTWCVVAGAGGRSHPHPSSRGHPCLSRRKSRPPFRTQTRHREYGRPCQRLWVGGVAASRGVTRAGPGIE